VGDTLLDAAGRPWATVLHPPHPPLVGSDNANSVVVRIDHAGRTLLLPGDLEAPGTERVLQLGRPHPDGVLMAPHHGSLSEDYGPLVDWARPATVVVSGGERADRPEVREVLGRGRADVWVTARQGAIRVRLGPRGPAQVDHWHIDRWRVAEPSPPWLELAASGRP
jgi:competence protein ComEC